MEYSQYPPIAREIRHDAVFPVQEVSPTGIDFGRFVAIV